MGVVEVSEGVARSQTVCVTTPLHTVSVLQRVSSSASEVPMRARRGFGFIALLFLLTVPLHADSPAVYAITNGTIHTPGGADIPNGVVIIRDGLIEAAGAGIAIPADA